MAKVWTSSKQKRWIIILIVMVIFLISVIHYNFWYSFTPLPSVVEPEFSPPNNLTANILVVSAYFPLKKSKHTLSDYKRWMSQFLQLETPIYLFISPSYTHVLPDPLPPHITINTSLSSPFDATPLIGKEEAYERMWATDREKKVHNPELYAIWTAKPWLLDQAARITGQKYDYYFWSDVGAFREHHYYRNWPAAERVRQVWHDTGNDGTIFFPVLQPPASRHKSWREEDGPIDQDISEGSFFGGSPSAVSWYSRTYTAYHDHYLSMDYLVGKDQNLINALFLLFPSRFHGVFYNDPLSPTYIAPTSRFDHRYWRQHAHDTGSPYHTTRALGKCGNEWYYYEYFLASEEDRENMRQHWLLMTGKDFYDLMYKPTRNPRCRLTVSFKMEDLLRREGVFGRDWTPPAHHVQIDA